MAEYSADFNSLEATPATTQLPWDFKEFSLSESCLSSKKKKEEGFYEKVDLCNVSIMLSDTECNILSQWVTKTSTSDVTLAVIVIV